MLRGVYGGVKILEPIGRQRGVRLTQVKAGWNNASVEWTACRCGRIILLVSAHKCVYGDDFCLNAIVWGLQEGAKLLFGYASTCVVTLGRADFGRLLLNPNAWLALSNLKGALDLTEVA